MKNVIVIVLLCFIPNAFGDIIYEDGGTYDISSQVNERIFLNNNFWEK